MVVRKKDIECIMGKLEKIEEKLNNIDKLEEKITNLEKSIIDISKSQEFISKEYDNQKNIIDNIMKDNVKLRTLNKELINEQKKVNEIL